MKRWLWLALLLLPCAMHAQVVGPGFINYVTSAPSGACSQGEQMRVVIGLGTVYTCQSGTWAQVGTAGGAGTVTSVLGTTNQINSDGNTVTPTLSLSSTLVLPGTLTSSGTSLFTTTTANTTFFGIKNTTAAVVGTSQGSPVFSLCGRAFHGSADVEDCMTFKELPGNGNDAAITQTIGHTGTSTGLFTLNMLGAFAVGTPATGLVAGRMSVADGIASGVTFYGSDGNGYIQRTNSTFIFPFSLQTSGSYTTTGAGCANAATPAICGGNSVGSVAVPTGATPTLTINTTAVTSSSQILLTIDESLGTRLSVTCNTSLATLVQPVVTARTGGTSFTIQINSTLVTNPACVNYVIIN